MDHKINQRNKLCSNLLLTAVTFILLFIYICIFAYLNIGKYTQHIDSDIAADALLCREIWESKDISPDHWVSSTERRILSVPTLSAVFYGITGSMTLSMGLTCTIVGILFLASFALLLKRCRVSLSGIAVALLALCALPINGLRNEGQMVPFVILLWFLFADYYALHCICLFLCIAFYLYLRDGFDHSERKKTIKTIFLWAFLVLFCLGLSLGGMRCMQVIVLPLLIWECLSLFYNSDHMTHALPLQRLPAMGFILSLTAVSLLARIYPGSMSYPMFFQTAEGMTQKLFLSIPAAILDCLGIAGNCRLASFSALMQLGILAVFFLTIYGIFFLHSQNAGCTSEPSARKALTQIFLCVLLTTVLIETVTTAEAAQNYFFSIWFLVAAVPAILITHFEKKAPCFAGIITLFICLFALCNITYTYKDCITTTDNLREYEEVIACLDSENIEYGYAQFWDASRISVMTDGRLTIGHCNEMEHLQMHWWLTSTKWYVPSLPEQMRTAYIVRQETRAGFEAQFDDPSVVTLKMENSRFAVYISDHNFVHR